MINLKREKNVKKTSILKMRLEKNVKKKRFKNVQKMWKTCEKVWKMWKVLKNRKIHIFFYTFPNLN